MWLRSRAFDPSPTRYRSRLWSSPQEAYANGRFGRRVHQVRFEVNPNPSLFPILVHAVAPPPLATSPRPLSRLSAAPTTSSRLSCGRRRLCCHHHSRHTRSTSRKTTRLAVSNVARSRTIEQFLLNKKQPHSNPLKKHSCYIVIILQPLLYHHLHLVKFLK